MVEVVAAMTLDGALPAEGGLGLVLHGNTCLEVGVEVLATIPSILRYQKCV